MRALDFLCWVWIGSMFGGRSGFGIGAVSTRGVRQLDAQGGKRQRLSAGVVWHVGSVAYILGE